MDSSINLINADGNGTFVLACEHASNFVPLAYNRLGITEEELESHVGWDPGAMAVARVLSSLLDAPLVSSTVSRALIDCNRQLDSPTLIPIKTELTEIPGNRNLPSQERQKRIEEVYRPFHDALDRTIKSQEARNIAPVILVTVHSFNPIYFGEPREVEVGFQHGLDSRFTEVCVQSAANFGKYKAALNSPYGPGDGVSYVIDRHGHDNGLHHVMIEVRNDIPTNVTDQNQVASWLASILLKAKLTVQHM